MPLNPDTWTPQVWPRFRTPSPFLRLKVLCLERTSVFAFFRNSSHISTHLPNLRTLNLKFHSRTEIHLTELLSLTLFTKLEELHLTSSHPNLRELSLYCAQENLTTNSPVALGQSCRSLVVCTIKCLQLDLFALEDKASVVYASNTPLYPELTDLSAHYLLLPNSPRRYPSSSRDLIATYLDVTDGDEDMFSFSSDEWEQSSNLGTDHPVIANQVSVLTTHFSKAAYFRFWTVEKMTVPQLYWEFTEAVQTAWMEVKRQRGERVRLARLRQRE
ncbi:hypothetical protein BJY00DRAFT_308457 [Aspergillus carlsbadensis]|nr:hypothetical protein BJY00DRAFT_308457 [Aspergillus carlsbadensis]